jgi:hypothetical protein
LAFQINWNRSLPAFQLDNNNHSDDDSDDDGKAPNDSNTEMQKIFNNAPGRIVSIIREEADNIQFL